MVQFDGLRPARLKVGIISAGRVGTALGVALERVDHVVVAPVTDVLNLKHAVQLPMGQSGKRHGLRCANSET